MYEYIVLLGLYNLDKPNDPNIINQFIIQRVRKILTTRSMENRQNTTTKILTNFSCLTRLVGTPINFFLNPTKGEL